VILYADRVTDSMAIMIAETERRRSLQLAHNAEHGIRPTSIRKSREQVLASTSVADSRSTGERRGRGPRAELEPGADLETLARTIEGEMKAAASRLDFETAALLRDDLLEVRSAMGGRRRALSGARAEPGSRTPAAEGTQGGASARGGGSAAATPTAPGPVREARRRTFRRGR
jgi:hypothetical protein